MLYWTIQITLISFILIFLVHHLINFFKSTLTVPKIKDLVNTPTQKYENMYNIIINKNNTNLNPNLSLNSMPNINYNEYSEIDLLPKVGTTNMKDELKLFLKKQLNNSVANQKVDSYSSSTDISALDNMMQNNYST